MINRLMMAKFTSKTGHLKFSTVVALALTAALTALTAEATTNHAPSKETVSRQAGEPIMAIVSIKSQHISLYDANRRILHAPVSTGTTGRETPAGIFAVVEKNKEHRSNMYDDASMPNMQRITWNGIAMHGGPLPGYPASHGCVRLPYNFAGRLFGKTRIGMRVIISPDDATPTEIYHPSLLSPNTEAVAAAPRQVDRLAREAKETAKAAAEAKKTAKSTARQAKLQKTSLRKLEKRKKTADTKLSRAVKTLTAAKKAKLRAEVRQRKTKTQAIKLSTQLSTSKLELKEKSPTLTDNKTKKGEKTKKSKAELRQEAALRKLAAQKKSADAKYRSANKALTAAEKVERRAVERHWKAINKTSELATKTETAKSDLEAKTTAAAIAQDTLEAARIRKDETAKAALDAKLATEPVSIYISRATERLYVRRNTHKPAPDGGGEVFDSSIEVPITIRDPYKPIGTHIFTAMDNDETGGLRWTVVTINDSVNAMTALDRVTIPQEVLDRIEPTALPRSSIIISDEPLSEETNYRTEFVTVLSDQPQGGFITREPEEKPVAANWDISNLLDH